MRDRGGGEGREEVLELERGALERLGGGADLARAARVGDVLDREGRRPAGSSARPRSRPRPGRAGARRGGRTSSSPASQAISPVATPAPTASRHTCSTSTVTLPSASACAASRAESSARRLVCSESATIEASRSSGRSGSGLKRGTPRLSGGPGQADVRGRSRNGQVLRATRPGGGPLRRALTGGGGVGAAVDDDPLAGEHVGAAPGSGRPARRPRGARCGRAAASASSSEMSSRPSLALTSFAPMSVTTRPGATMLTRMPLADLLVGERQRERLQRGLGHVVRRAVGAHRVELAAGDGDDVGRAGARASPGSSRWTSRWRGSACVVTTRTSSAGSVSATECPREAMPALSDEQVDRAELPRARRRRASRRPGRSSSPAARPRRRPRAATTSAAASAPRR